MVFGFKYRYRYRLYCDHFQLSRRKRVTDPTIMWVGLGCNPWIRVWLPLNQFFPELSYYQITSFSDGFLWDRTIFGSGLDSGLATFEAVHFQIKPLSCHAIFSSGPLSYWIRRIFRVNFSVFGSGRIVRVRIIVFQIHIGTKSDISGSNQLCQVPFHQNCSVRSDNDSLGKKTLF